MGLLQRIKDWMGGQEDMDMSYLLEEMPNESRAMFDPIEADEIRSFYKSGESTRTLAKRFSTSKETIRNVVNRTKAYSRKRG